MSTEFDVFISYKREERALADQVASALEDLGYTQVSDLNLAHGDQFGDAIDRMIRSARAVLVLWTPASAGSDWVKDEARLAIELETYLGVMVEQAELPVDLKFKQYIDVSDLSPADALSKIIEETSTTLGPAQNTPGHAATESADLNDDLRLFETAERLNTISAYDAYLAAFPEGVMADVARTRRTDLTTWSYRFRRLLPSAAAVGALAAVLTLVLQAFFSEKADKWFERDVKIAELEEALANAPDPNVFRRLEQALKEKQAQLAATPTPEYIAKLQADLDAAPKAKDVETLRQQLANAREDLKAAPSPVYVAKLQAQLDTAPKPQDVERLEQQLADTKKSLNAAPTHEYVAKLQAELKAAPKAEDFENLRRQLHDAKADLENAPSPEYVAKLVADLESSPDLEEVEHLREMLFQAKSAFEKLPDRNASRLLGLALSGISIPEPDCTTISKTMGYSFPGKLCVDVEATNLDLSDRDQLSKSDFRKIAALANLKKLDLESTNVTDSDLVFLPSLERLEELNLSFTEISQLHALKSLSSLIVLRLTSTRVENLEPLSGLISLEELRLAFVPIEDINPLAHLTKLQTLVFDGGYFEDIASLRNNAQLSYLSISNTPLKDVSALSGMNSLRFLSLNNTKVQDLSALAGLQSLFSLDLRGSPISSFATLKTIPRLRELKTPTHIEIEDRDQILAWVASRE